MSLEQQQAGNEENCTGTSNWTLYPNSTASTIGIGENDGDELEKVKMSMVTLEAKNKMLEAKLEKLESKVENHALKVNAEQKANYQALESKLAKMLATQNGQHQKEMAKLKKNLTFRPYFATCRTLNEARKKLRTKMDNPNNNNNNRANQCNPNHRPTGPGHSAAYSGDGSKANLDNHANQMNPNNPAYQFSRGGGGIGKR